MEIFLDVKPFPEANLQWISALEQGVRLFSKNDDENQESKKEKNRKKKPQHLILKIDSASQVRFFNPLHCETAEPFLLAKFEPSASFFSHSSSASSKHKHKRFLGKFAITVSRDDLNMDDEIIYESRVFEKKIAQGESFDLIYQSKRIKEDFIFSAISKRLKSNDDNEEGENELLCFLATSFLSFSQYFFFKTTLQDGVQLFKSNLFESDEKHTSSSSSSSSRSSSINSSINSENSGFLEFSISPFISILQFCYDHRSDISILDVIDTLQVAILPSPLHNVVHCMNKNQFELFHRYQETHADRFENRPRLLLDTLLVPEAFTQVQNLKFEDLNDKAFKNSLKIICMSGLTNFHLMSYIEYFISKHPELNCAQYSSSLSSLSNSIVQFLDENHPRHERIKRKFQGKFVVIPLLITEINPSSSFASSIDFTDSVGEESEKKSQSQETIEIISDDEEVEEEEEEEEEEKQNGNEIEKLIDIDGDNCNDSDSSSQSTTSSRSTATSQSSSSSRSTTSSRSSSSSVSSSDDDESDGHGDDQEGEHQNGSSSQESVQKFDFPNHFVTIIIDMTTSNEKNLIYFDSLTSNFYYQIVHNLLKSHNLQDKLFRIMPTMKPEQEAKGKGKKRPRNNHNRTHEENENGHDDEENRNGEEEEEEDSTNENIRLQRDGWSCGFWCLWFIHFFFRCNSLNIRPKFNLDHQTLESLQHFVAIDFAACVLKILLSSNDREK